MWRVKIKHCTTLNVMPMIPRIRDVTPVTCLITSCFVTYAWPHGQNACFHTTGRIVMRRAAPRARTGRGRGAVASDVHVQDGAVMG